MPTALPAPEPAPISVFTLATLLPCRALLSATHRAGLRSGLRWWSGAGAAQTLPATAQIFRPQLRGCPGLPGRSPHPLPSALAFRARCWSGWLGVSWTRGRGTGRGPGQVQISVEAGCVSKSSVLLPTPVSFAPPHASAERLRWSGYNSRDFRNEEALQFLALPAQPPEWAEKPRHPEWHSGGEGGVKG